MVHLPYLQPFADVNKRVSRLAANIPLIRDNLCPLSFIDVSQQAYVDAMLGVYEFNRIELLRDVFVWAYERSCQQYVAVRQSLVPPDMLRLRYRQALSDVIAAIVRDAEPATESTVRALKNFLTSHCRLALSIRAPNGNALALTWQGDCITISAVHPIDRSALWLPPLKSNPP
jgi:hypothetical protein